VPNNCVVNFVDLGVMKAAFFSTPSSQNWNADADLNGDNAVNFVDLGILKQYFFRRPGPSSTTECT
jgi:Dockerin type I domain